MSSFLKRILLYLFVAFFVVETISFIIVYTLLNSQFYKNFDIYNDPKVREANLLILGSSRGLTTINTQLLEDSLNTKAYNLSMDDTRISLHRVLLELVIQNTAIPDSIILVYDESKNLNKKSGNDHRLLPLIHHNRVVFEYYKKYYGSWQAYLYNALPFLYLGKYNIDLLFPSIFALKDNTYKYRANQYGDYMYPVSSNTDDQNKYTEKHVSLSCENPEFIKIREICNEYDISLIVYLAPILSQKQTLSCPNVIVINHSQLFSSHKEMYDVQHVNPMGRDRATIQLIHDIRNMQAN